MYMQRDSAHTLIAIEIGLFPSDLCRLFLQMTTPEDFPHTLIQVGRGATLRRSLAYRYIEFRRILVERNR